MWKNSEETEDSLTGQMCNDFQILTVIGSGTFGKVYKVKQCSTGHIFAMKHVLQNKKYKNRELDIIRQVQSKYVIALHTHFYHQQKEGTFLNLVMEYQPQPLSKIIKTNLPSKKYIPFPQIKQYVRCLLTALKDLHAIHICHRDIKPSNILVNQHQAKICDLGSAKMLNPNQKNIAYICSRYYRAPQLLLGAVYYSQQIDIWSMGCVIAQMMTNHALFQGSNATVMLSKIIKCLGSPTKEDLKAMLVQDQDIGLVQMQGSGVKQRMLKYNANCPGELIELIERMLVYNPHKRITAAQALNMPLWKE